MEFNVQSIQQLSRLSSRGVFGLALADIEQHYPQMKVVVADVLTSARCEGLFDRAPHKVVNVGIAEQNMVGIAAGLASEGYNVFATTFAPFASMRCFEMLRTQLGYMNLNVKVVGLLSGLAGGPFGNTHYGLEDIAITRTIPNMTVLSPADCVETYKAIEAAAAHTGPMYIRLTGINGTPAVYKGDYDFTIGKGIVLKEGTDVAIIATGTMVNEAMRATRALNKHGISCSIINIHTIKPLDTELLTQIINNHKLIVTVEEHFKTGGLGEAVATFKADMAKAPPQMLLGIPDMFPKAGEYNWMLQQCGLSAPQIVEAISKKYKEI